LRERFLEGEFDTVLTELTLARTERRREAAERTIVEDRLKGICERVLHTALDGRRIDIHDNLFDIGADSITLVQIHEEIDREHPGKIALVDLSRLPTIADLARHLSGTASRQQPQNIAREHIG
jgi:aryl carrier-like protein